MNKSANYIKTAQIDTFLFGIPSILVNCKKYKPIGKLFEIRRRA